MRHLTVVCIIFIVISLIFVGISRASIDPETCVGMWLFDEGEGDTAKDSTKNGNDGTVNNAPKWISGKFGKAVEFSGSDSIVVPDVASLNFETDSFSVVTWFTFASSQDWNRLVRERNPSPWGSGNYGWEIQTQGLRIHLSLDDKAGNHVKTTYEDAGDGEWRHTAMIVDRDEQLLITYLDGENQKTADTTIIGSVTDTLPVTIGGGFIGAIDEVAIFNVILSEDDVQKIMNQGLEKAVEAAVSPSGKLAITWGQLKID